MAVGDVPLTPIIDTVTGSVTEIGRIFLRTLTAAVNGLAPIDAAYWTSRAAGILSAEVNLGALASGYLKINTAVGIAAPATVTTIPQADVTGLAASLAGKANVPIAQTDVTGLPAALAAKAPLASPALTGVPTGPTAAPGTNTVQLATTAFAVAAAAAGGGGTWVNQPFNAAHYSAAGGGTWTIGASAVVLNRYALIGKVLIWELYIAWFAGGNVATGTVTGLQVTLPAGLSAGGPTSVPVAFLVDGATQAGYANPSGATLTINKYSGNFTSGTPGFILTVVFEVA